MTCTEFRATILDTPEVVLDSRAVRAVYIRHVVSCPACAAWIREEEEREMGRCTASERREVDRVCLEQFSADRLDPEYCEVAYGKPSSSTEKHQ